ncbi:DMT family transporter, partial [Paracoccaceae bacterium]|nr:DMT family transporter [Paracoccaceae bacterium]
FGALFFVTAIALTPLATASSILQATPLVVTLGAAVFLKERVGWRRWTASLVGFAGVLLILRPGMAGFQPESLFAVLGVLCLSARDLATRVMRAQLSSVTVSIYAFVATACAGVIALPFTGPFTPLQDVNWFLFAGAVLIGCFAYFTLISATRIGDASVVSPFRYSRLIFALALAMGFLGERPDSTTFIGAAIILTSGIYIFWRERVLDRKTG